MTALAVPTRRSGAVRAWLVWTAGFVCFPLAGVSAAAVAGRVDTVASALLAGLVTGAVIGLGQSLASLRRLDPLRWAVATTLGMGVGLMVGATAVGFGTSLTDLIAMGALTGVFVGVAQALALPVGTRRRWTWAAAMPVLWALGWTVTTTAGIEVTRQFSVFGAFGAITCSALTGALLARLVPARTSLPARPDTKDPR